MNELTPSRWAGPVRRVKTPTGSRIEPPLSDHWSDTDKLLWNAAITALDTGLTIRVHRGGYSIGGITQRGYYSVQVGSSSCGPMRFGDAWKFLNGVSVGAEQAHHQHHDERPVSGAGMGDRG